MGKILRSCIHVLYNRRIECKLFFTVCVCVFCVSCTSLYDRNNWFVGSGINYSIVPLALNGSSRGGYFDEETHSFSEDARKYWSDRMYLENLEKKVKEGIDTVKNKQLIVEIDKELLLRRNERIEQRLEFLRSFYADMVNMNSTDFTLKYKKHCSRGILKCLRASYLKEKNEKGYDWKLFTNADASQMNHLTVSFMDDEWGGLDRNSVDFMYGSDTIWVKDNVHPYFNEEDKWYSVTDGRQNIYVMVEGQNPHIAITGILNIARDVSIITEYDR